MDKWAILVWNGEAIVTEYICGFWGPVPLEDEIVWH